MQKSQIIQPTALQAPFAAQGDKNIPNYEATGTETCSIKLGFLPITSEQLPPDGNGQAPERVDFNGMFYLTTDLRVYLQNGSLITFDSAVSTKIGGYPKDAILTYIDSNKNLALVRSCIENNNQNFITDPTLINGSVWEFVPFFNAGGAWQNWNSDMTVLTTVTAVGNYDINLSSILPNDDHNYECVLRYFAERRDANSNDSTYGVYSMNDKVWLHTFVEGDQSLSTNYKRISGQIVVVVGTNRKIKLKIANISLNGQELDLIMYRRSAE